MTASEFADDGASDGRGPPDPAATDVAWHRRRWTTIVLEEHGDGWRATQTGVDVEGRGATAADAAAAYCRRIAETGDERAGEERDGGSRDESAARGGRDG